MHEILGKPRVLVIDDDPEYRDELIPEVLKRLGAKFDVEKAENVREGCEIAARQAETGTPFDLIVLDMHMPPKHGARLATDAGIQVLRSLRLLASLAPAVVFTAFHSYENCVRAVQAGAAAYLPKPVAMDGEQKPEGGIDALVETCGRLLTKPEADTMRPPSDTAWIEQNHEWLYRKFKGQCVAAMPTSVAKSAGITGTEREDWVVVSRDSREELARLIAVNLPFLDTFPEIVTVSRARSS